jgi:hypothetical protein
MRINIMQRRNFLLAMAGTMVTLAAGAAQASAPWLWLGRRRVGLFVDHDQIKTGSWKIFQKLKLTVSGNALYIYDLKVTYHNGGVQHIPVRWRIPEGGATRTLDLNGSIRIVRKVEFIYGKMPNGRGRTYVNLYGQI